MWNLHAEALIDFGENHGCELGYPSETIGDGKVALSITLVLLSCALPFYKILLCGLQELLSCSRGASHTLFLCKHEIKENMQEPLLTILNAFFTREHITGGGSINMPARHLHYVR
jgi:hypothetical protein